MVTWIRKVSLADLFTLGNGMLGFFAITYMLDEPSRPVMASLFILAAMVFDGLDGLAARLLGSKHSVGQYLDSFSDLISFALAPAALIYFSYYIPGRYSFVDILAAVGAFAFLVLGALRLARFSRAGHLEENFSGLPTPAATFLVLMLLVFCGPLAQSFVPLPSALVLAMALAISVGMVLDIPYPKIRTAGTGALALSGIALALIGFGSLEFGADRNYAFAALLGSLVLILVYVVVAPIVEIRRRASAASTGVVADEAEDRPQDGQ